MKPILIFFLFFSVTAFCQDSVPKELLIPFEFHTQGYEHSKIWIMGAQFDYFIDGSYDYTAELPHSGTGKYVERRQFYHTHDHRFVELIEHFADGTIFFKEWSDSTKWDLLNFGELELDPNVLRADSVQISSVNGEDSLVIDSVFTFRKVGPWQFRVSENVKLFGNYEHGARVGTWTEYLSDGTSIASFVPVLVMYEYENGKLKLSNRVDKSKLPNAEKLKFLNGKWTFYPWDAKTVAMCKQGYCICIAHKTEKATFPNSMRFMGTLSCGVGPKESPLEWKLNNDGTLTIDTIKFVMLYLTDEYLVFKQEM